MASKNYKGNKGIKGWLSYKATGMAYKITKTESPLLGQLLFPFFVFIIGILISNIIKWFFI